jgi:hypothetical protein
VKSNYVKKLVIVIAASLGLAITAFAAEQLISLNSSTTFPVDI